MRKNELMYRKGIITVADIDQHTEAYPSLDATMFFVGNSVYIRGTHGNAIYLRLLCGGVLQQAHVSALPPPTTCPSAFVPYKI